MPKIPEKLIFNKFGMKIRLKGHFVATVYLYCPLNYFLVNYRQNTFSVFGVKKQSKFFHRMTHPLKTFLVVSQISIYFEFINFFEKFYTISFQY